MKVIIKFFTILRELVGKREDTIEVAEHITVGELLDKLMERYGDKFSNYIREEGTGRIDPSLQFLVDGVNIRSLQGFDTRLKEGSVVAIIPPVGGG